MPVWVDIDARMSKEVAERRFRDVCDRIREGRAVRDPLVYVTWADILGLDKRFSIAPAKTVKVTMTGPDVDLIAEDF